MKFRLFLSAVLFVVFGFFNRMHEVVSPLISGPLAANQFNNSNIDYIGAQTGMSLFNGSGLPVFVLFILILVVWYKPIWKLIKGDSTNVPSV